MIEKSLLTSVDVPGIARAYCASVEKLRTGECSSFSDCNFKCAIAEGAQNFAFISTDGFQERKLSLHGRIELWWVLRNFIVKFNFLQLHWTEKICKQTLRSIEIMRNFELFWVVLFKKNIFYWFYQKSEKWGVFSFFEEKVRRWGFDPKVREYEQSTYVPMFNNHFFRCFLMQSAAWTCFPSIFFIHFPNSVKQIHFD